MFIAQDIHQTVESCKNKILGFNSYHKITRVLNKAFGKKDLKFKFETFDDFPNNTYSFSGIYDLYSNTRFINLNVSSKSFDLALSESEWCEFKFLLSQVIQHETIHQNQWQNRVYEDGPCRLDFRNMYGSRNEEMEYLSDIDEIDAYAHDIAMEIKFYYKNRDPYECLSVINKLRKVPSYSLYKKTFRGVDWFLIRKQLLLKTYKWMPYA